MTIEQGDIIKAEGLKGCYLIVSKNYFNMTEQAILCPIIEDAFQDPLHIAIGTEEMKGDVLCEQMRLVDLRYRGFKRIGRIPYEVIMDITDAIQGIFDY